MMEIYKLTLNFNQKAEIKRHNEPRHVDDEVVCDSAEHLDAVDVVLDGVGGGLVLAEIHPYLYIDPLSSLVRPDGGEAAEHGLVADAVEPVSERSGNMSVTDHYIILE